MGQLKAQRVTTTGSDGAVIDTSPILSRAFIWTLPATGFASPMYLADDKLDGTGWDISRGASVVMSFEGTYTGAAAVHEQTLDESGASGWFPVFGRATTGIPQVSSGGTSTGVSYIYPVIGARGRMRFGALSTGEVKARVGLSMAPAEVYLPYASNAVGGIATWARLVSCANSDNATVAKTSAGRLFTINGYNGAASVRYLKIYNKASSPSGSDTPVMTLALAPTASFKFDFGGELGAYFSAGISYRIVTGSADNDTTAPTAGDVLGLNMGIA